MSLIMETKLFSDWLQDEMNKRGWSQSDLSRNSGVNRQVISTYINQQRKKPDENILIDIARALNLPPETVFRAAGLLPPVSEDEAKFEDWKYLLDGLSERDLNLLRDIAEKMAAENEKERALKSLNPGRVGNG
jgi:transcriptional regulator with XRE-family HTH domain